MTRHVDSEVFSRASLESSSARKAVNYKYRDVSILVIIRTNFLLLRLVVLIKPQLRSVVSLRMIILSFSLLQWNLLLTVIDLIYKHIDSKCSLYCLFLFSEKEMELGA